MITVHGELFLAELSDQTQLAVISFVAGRQPRWAVVLGAAFALVTSAALAVLIGESLLRVVRPAYVQLAAAALLLVVAVIVGRGALADLRGLNRADLRKRGGLGRASHS